MAQRRMRRKTCSYSKSGANESKERPRRVGLMHVFQSLPIFCQLLIKNRAINPLICWASPPTLFSLRHMTLVEISVVNGETSDRCAPCECNNRDKQRVLGGITKGYLLRFKVHLAARSSSAPCSFWQVTSILLCLNFPQSERGYYGTFLAGSF